MIDYVRLTLADSGKVGYYPKEHLIAWSGHKYGASKVFFRYADGEALNGIEMQDEAFLVMENPDDIADQMSYAMM